MRFLRRETKMFAALLALLVAPPLAALSLIACSGDGPGPGTAGSTSTGGSAGGVWMGFGGSGGTGPGGTSGFGNTAQGGSGNAVETGGATLGTGGSPGSGGISGGTGGAANGGASASGGCSGTTVGGLPCCFEGILGNCTETGPCTYQYTAGVGTTFCYRNGLKLVSTPAAGTSTQGSASRNGVLCYTYTTDLQNDGTLYTYVNPQGGFVGTVLYSNNNQTTATCAGQSPVSFPSVAAGETCTAGSCS